MTGYSIKLKTKNGQHVIKDMDATTTIGDLKVKIARITGIAEKKLHILYGFPPVPLDLSSELDNISLLGISNGDTFIVEDRSKADLGGTVPYEDVESQQKNVNGVLLKKVVPADNSCLFTSIGYVLNGNVDTECGLYMRCIIAEHVAADTINYNEAILGKPNAEYCEWIQHPESWGGAIEVSILSNFYGIEIDVVDITNAIINRFGEDKCFGLRAFLLFDGIHYDPIYMEPAGGGPPVTIFPLEDSNVYQQAEQLALEAKASRQYTDINKFTLRCMQCDSLLVGQNGAIEHVKLTGHSNFGEI